MWFPHLSVQGTAHTEGCCLMCHCWGWAVVFHEKVLRLTKTWGFQAFFTLNMVAEGLCPSRSHWLRPMSLYTPGFCLHQFILRWYGQRESSLSHYQDTSDDGINRSEIKVCDWKYLASHYSFLEDFEKKGFGSQRALFFQLCVYSSCYLLSTFALSPGIILYLLMHLYAGANYF